MLLIKRIFKALLVLNDSFEKDKRLTGYLFLGKPWGMIGTICLYLYFVLKWGPRFMANRKPYKVEGLMKVYNLVQILLNCAIFYESWTYSYRRSDFSYTCEKLDFNDTRASTMSLVRPALLYYLSKYLDLFDTIFFLLRKKYNQISFLHVYHHSLMIFAVYVYCTFLFASHFTITGVLNSFIHICMYTYYEVAAMKPKINLRPYKKLLTTLQILQFTYLAVHYSLPIFNNWCKVGMFWTILSCLQNTFMITLFGHFYYKEYILKDRKIKLHKVKS